MEGRVTKTLSVLISTSTVCRVFGISLTERRVVSDRTNLADALVHRLKLWRLAVHAHVLELDQLSRLSILGVERLPK